MIVRSTTWNNGGATTAALFGTGLRDTVSRVGVAPDDAGEIHVGERPKGFLAQHEFG